MKKIPLTLQRKYVAYCYQFMSEQQTKDFNMVYRAIGALLKGSGIADTDDVAFEIDPYELIRLWEGIGKRQETWVARLHREMKQIIDPQIAAHTQSSDQDLLASVMVVIGFVQGLDAQIDLKEAAWIAAGNELIEA